MEITCCLCIVQTIKKLRFIKKTLNYLSSLNGLCLASIFLLFYFLLHEMKMINLTIKKLRLIKNPFKNDSTVLCGTIFWPRLPDWAAQAGSDSYRIEARNRSTVIQKLILDRFLVFN